MCVHFAQAFEPAYVDFGIGSEFLFEKFVAMLVVGRIDSLGAVAEAVKWGNGKIEMSVFDELGHFLIEKCDEERCDVRAIHICVGHDDDPLVSQIVVAVFRPRTDAQGLNEVG